MKTIIFLFIVSVFINGVFGDEVKSVSVMEGDSLTLQTDVPDIQTDNDLTLTWTFGSQKDTSIAHINRAAKTTSINADVLNGRFRDRLKMNNQTGDLTITNITTQHSGFYNVRIHVKKNIIERSFNVKSVKNPESEQLKSVLVKDGDSVTLLTDVHYFKKYDEIQWRFQEIPIAEFNKSVSKISEDERFRDKMQLDVQTGSLQINHIRTDLSGLYEVDLTSSGSYTIHQSFTVTVIGEVKSVSAINGDPLTINTDVPDIKSYDQILLIFGCDDRIAEVNKQNKQFTLYGRIRDRLTLNDQTGDLTITNIKNEDAGDYELKMSSSRRSIQRRFRVNVSEQGLSPGAIAGISVFFLLLAAAAAAGVIYYRRKIAEAMKQIVTMLEVDEGKSVDLKTEVKNIKRDDVIEWRFGESLIAEINPANNIFITYDGDDDLFRDKLKLNDQTGDLNIGDIRHKHTGVYTLRIIRDGETSYKRFRVFVRFTMLEVDEGKSVDLKTKVTDIQRVEKIEWRFGETLIAEINPANNIFSTYDDDKGLFRDKLKLNPQTGDLNISDIREEHTGVYKLKIIRDGETSDRKFRVFVRCDVETLRVDEGKSVDLKTEVNIRRVDLIEWRFGETLIAEINPANNIFITYDGDDDLFRDKLKLNHQTGDLTIDDIREKHTGVYKLKIIRDGETSYKRFRVFVRCETKTLEVDEGKSVDLKTEVNIRRVDLIEWRFEETPIAKINPANNIFSTYDGDDGLFRDKLKLNPQTGDLNINDIRQKHTGVYKLKIIRDGETSYKRFSVFVRGETETLKVDEWKSVDLKTEVTDIKRDDLIEWRFGFRETLIAEINPANNIFSTYDGDDGLFRDKLNLNHKTGDLTIKSITWKHNGDYILKIIRDGETSYRRFRVSFYNTQLNVGEGKSVDLKTEVKDIKRDDLIEWTFGKTIIAKINPVNNIFNTYKGGDDLFKYKLKLNPQTGDLNIKEIRQKHTGVYILKIIRDGKTSDKRFFVSIKDNVETLQVDEEKSVTLKTEVTDIQRVDLIEWRFGETLIAKINPANNIFRKFYGDYGEFRYKLKVNHQTGDLNINDIRWQQDGVYLLKIIRDGETSYKRFSVSVRFAILKVDEGESVNLKAEVKNIKRDDVIEWRFKETLIAQINPVNNIFSTYDGDDDLFRDKLKLNHQTGDLNINDIRLEHTGVYELKITRDGETSDRRLFVSVTEKTKELKVNKGKSVDLKTEVKDIKRGDLIEWRFRKNLIAQINPANKSPITYDDAFRGKLKLKPQTGDLTINDIREEHSGVYLLKITRGGKISYMRFKVSVMDNLETLEVDEGKSVDLKAEVNIHYVDLIEWRFEKTLIAEINPANKIFSTYDGDDDEFRDKLKLNHQTGDLNISDIRWEHDGVYKLKIIRGGKPSYRSFEVIVRSSRGEDSVEKRGGDSVEKRGGDSVGIEMDPLLNNSSQ